MKENLEMGKKLALEHADERIILFIPENGKKIIFMDLEYSKLKIRKNTKDNLLWIH